MQATSNNNTETTPPQQAPAASSLESEKAAIKQSMQEQANFRDEKQRIVQAMGGSRAELVSPSADPRLQRKLNSAFLKDDVDGTTSLDSDSSGAPGGVLQEPTTTSRPVPEQHPDSDDLPIAFDHSDEQELYDVEEGRVNNNKVDKKKIYCVAGIVTLLLIIGGVVGAVLAFTRTGGSSPSQQQPPVTLDEADSSDAECVLNRDALTRCENGVLAVPECAREAFQELKKVYLAEEELACDAAHQGLVALAVAQTNSSDGVDDPTEFFVLSTFFFSLGGVQWQTNDNWLEGSSPCSGNWYGVEWCHPDGSFDIWLEANRLQGTVPTEIGMLSNLKNLNIGRNEVEGTLPSEIGLLTNLQSLGLGLLQIQSAMPSEIGMLQELTVLHLSRTRFEGTIPTEMGNLVNLVDFGFTETKFTGELPSELGGLVSLENLDMENVHSLTGTIPSEWERMTSLRTVYISAFGLAQSPLPSFISTATNLMSIQILSTDLTGNLDSLVHLSSLQQVFLSLNQLTGTIPTEIGLLSNLGRLNVEFAPHIEGTLPTEVGLLTNLQELVLWKNVGITGAIPSELGLLTKLVLLDLHETSLTGSIPSELCELETPAVIRTCDPEVNKLCKIETCQ